jgi:Leucine-rich repeat (LRR) protein
VTNTVCDWYGVICDNGPNVSELNLSDNELTGTIPSGLGVLSQLTIFDLSDNELTGAIPSDLGDLSALTDLYLSQNELSGSIPSVLGGLAELRALDLSDNQLSGTIPSVLGDLSELTDLDLSQNELSGSIPSDLGDLSALMYLYLYANQLSGSIPSSLGNLTQLVELDLSQNLTSFDPPENGLSGTIPDELGNLTLLTRLDLSTNQLKSEIPTALGNLRDLTELNLSINLLYGSIPNQFNQLTDLTMLDLSFNSLSGSIPSLGNLSKLMELRLSYNRLSGSIPANLGNLSNLERLVLNYNELDGIIPSEFEGLSNLVILNLANNALVGSIPSQLGSLANLATLFLNNNNLCGEIPVTLQELPIPVFFDPFPMVEPPTDFPQLNLGSNHLAIPSDAALVNWLDDRDPDWRSQTGSCLGGLLKFSPVTYDIDEDAGTVTISVARENGSAGTVSVDYITSNGTATVGQDYTKKVGTLSWGSGDTSNKTFDVNIIDDSLFEQTETFNLMLFDATGGAGIGDPSVAEVTINNDDPNPVYGTLQFSSASYSVNENGGTLEITVIRTDSDKSEISVDYVSSDGTAKVWEDYKLASGTLTWADGDSNDKSFFVEIVDDSVFESTKSFNLTLQNQTDGVVLGDKNPTVVTISDDDQKAGTLQFSDAAYSVNEPDGSVEITVSRIGGSDGNVYVYYKSSSGTAYGRDYTSIPEYPHSELSWADQDAADKTFTVNIADDSEFEGDETFNLQLYWAGGGASIGSPSDAVVTIVSDDPFPGTLQFSSATYSVNEDGGSIDVTVSRVGASDGEISVVCDSYTGGTATASEDYTSVYKTLTWADQDAEDKNCSVPILDDTIYEGDETFNLRLRYPSNGGEIGAQGEAIVTILEDEEKPESGTLQFSEDGYSVNENDGTIEIPVTRVAGKSGDISVQYATSNGTAIAGDDYAETQGTLSWADNETGAKIFSVPIIDDDVFDNYEETFNVTLHTPTNGAELGDPSTSVVTISDDERTTLQFSKAEYDVNEGNSSITITVTRVGGSDGSVSVYYKSSHGTAYGGDYTSVNSRLSWADQDTADKTFTVDIRSDDIYEDDETFNLTLSNPYGGAVLGETDTAVVTIVDNDPQPTLQFGSATYSVYENADIVTITVNRIGRHSRDISVEYATKDGEAIAGTDYTKTEGTLSWSPLWGNDSKTFTVVLLDDNGSEDEETFSLELKRADGGAIIGNPGETVVTITDDDQETPNPGTLRFSDATYSVNEDGGSIDVIVSRTGGKDGAVTVECTSSDETATEGDDYSAVSETLNWGDQDNGDKACTVTIIDDGIDEDNETFNMALENPTGGAEIGNQGTAVVTIVDESARKPGILQFSEAEYRVGEDGIEIVIKVERVDGSDGKISVDYATSDGTAIAGSDYVANSGTLEWEDTNGVAQFIIVDITNDDIFEENDETFSLTLDNPTGDAEIGDPATTEVTIVDDDKNPGTFKFSKEEYSVDESGGSININVKRVGGSDGDISVNYATSDDSTTVGSDYTESSGVLTWTHGNSAEKTLTVDIIDDVDIEGYEIFNVTLEGYATVPVTIRDDDHEAGILQFSEAEYSVNENAGTIDVIVSRIGGKDGAISVDCFSSDKTAKAGKDYSEFSETLSWGDQDTDDKVCTVTIIDDIVFEGNKTFSMSLGFPTGGAEIGELDEAVVTIVENEPNKAGILQFSLATYIVNEDSGTVEIAVNRVDGSNGAASVNVVTSDGTAENGEDYETITQKLEWNDGDNRTKKVHVVIIDDTELEGNETFYLELKDVKGAGLGNPNEAAVTIIDDETKHGTLQFSEAKYEVNEDGGTIDIIVSRTGGKDGAVTVDCVSSDDSAKAGEDYIEFSETLSWDDQDASDKSCTVTIIDDTDFEGNETFIMALENPTGGADVGDTAEVTIIEKFKSGSLQFSNATYNVNEDGGTIDVIVSRIGGKDGAVAVDCVSSDDSAKAGNDYSAVSETLEWDDLDADDKSCSVTIHDDTIYEGDETFNMALENPTGGAGIGNPNEAVVTIVENEDEPLNGILQFSNATYSVNELDGSVEITVRRVGGSNGVASVEVATSDDSAKNGEDYEATTQTLVWADGNNSDKSFTVDIIDDNEIEGNETFNLKLKSPDGAELGNPKDAVVTIVDNDYVAGTLQFSSATYRVDENATSVDITVTRVDGKDGATTVECFSIDDTAKAGEDYSEFSETLSWGDQETGNKTFTVDIINDEVFESNETFDLALDNVTGDAKIGNPITTEVTIVDNDQAAGTLQFSDATYSIDEDGGSISISVRRVDGSDGAVSVRYATNNGTAKADSDYAQSYGTLRWIDGDGTKKTFSVNIADDADIENDETFSLSLYFPTGGAEVGDQNEAVVTIVDNESNPGILQFSSATYSVNEPDGSVEITVSRVGGSDGAASVKVVTGDGTAENGDDYNKITQELEWGDGDNSDKTFTVNIIDDSVLEDNETFELKLKGANGAELGEQDTATVTIIDNEPKALIKGNVELQGREPKPHSSWETEIRVSLTVPSETQPRYSFTTTTDQNGEFEVGPVEPLTYDMRVKGTHTLQNKVSVSLTDGENVVNVGELREGDANDDNCTTILDFSILVSAFTSEIGDPRFDARTDFNQDGYVTILDFSLLKMNFTQCGAPEPSLMEISQTDYRRGGIVEIFPSTSQVEAGEVFEVVIEVQAGAQEVDGASAYLDFDPTSLEVLNMTSGDYLDLTLDNTFDNGAGIINFAAGKLAAPFPSGDFELVTIRLKAKTAMAEIPLGLVYSQPRYTDATFGGDRVY